MTTRQNEDFAAFMDQIGGAHLERPSTYDPNYRPPMPSDDEICSRPAAWVGLLVLLMIAVAAVQLFLLSRWLYGFLPAVSTQTAAGLGFCGVTVILAWIFFPKE